MRLRRCVFLPFKVHRLAWAYRSYHRRLGLGYFQCVLMAWAALRLVGWI